MICLQKAAVGVPARKAMGSRIENDWASALENWRQYRPWEEDGTERKNKSVNGATVWCFARRLISREWARALGRKVRDPRTAALEREAARYMAKREAERQRAEAGSRMVENRGC